MKINVEIVTDYAALGGLTARAYDLAFIHPTHIALAPVKRGGTRWPPCQRRTGYKASFLSKVNARQPPRRSRQDSLPAAASRSAPPGSELDYHLADRATLARCRCCCQDQYAATEVHPYRTRSRTWSKTASSMSAATASKRSSGDWTAAGGGSLPSSRAVPIKNLIVANALGENTSTSSAATVRAGEQRRDGRAKLEKIGLKRGFITHTRTTTSPSPPGWACSPGALRMSGKLPPAIPASTV